MTVLEEVQDGVACFNNTTVFTFPMCVGSVLSLDVALAENLNDMNYFDQSSFQWLLGAHTMVKDVL